MSALAMDIAKMIDMLPESEQLFAQEFVKRLVLAWDPDFTKLTPEERRELEQAEKDEFIEASEIDWDHLEKYDDKK